MKKSKPPVPEKPLVAAKPKRKPPAPPSPPKPTYPLPSSYSLPQSPVSSPEKPSWPSQQIIKNKDPVVLSNESCEVVLEILEKEQASNPTETSQDHNFEVKSHKLSRSPEPPALPALPPPVQRKVIQSPASTLSSITTSTSSSSSSSSVSSASVIEQKSSLCSTLTTSTASSSSAVSQSLSPSTKVPPPTSPKPKSPLQSCQGKVFADNKKESVVSDQTRLEVTCNESSEKDRFAAISPASSRTAGALTHDLEETHSITAIHPESKKEGMKGPSRSSPIVPPKKVSVPPNRPAYPPSRPAPPKRRPLSPPERPSKPSPKVTSTTSSTTSPNPQNTPHDEMTSLTEKDTDPSSHGTKRKLGAPPPLPKNPPRGGVLKQRCQDTFASGTQSSTETIITPREHLGPKLGTPNSCKVQDRAIIRTVKADSSGNSEREDQIREANVNTVTTAEVCEGVAESNVNDNLPIESAGKTFERLEDNSDSTVKHKVQARPIPRKRLSIPPVEIVTKEPVEVEKATESNSVSLAEESCPEPSEKSNSNLDSKSTFEISETSEQQSFPRAAIKPDQTKENLDISSAGTFVSDNSCDGVHISDGSCTIIQQSGKVINKTLDSDVSIVSTDNVCNTPIDTQHLQDEEPDSTCDMLKEIEELLKNKFGDIQTDVEDFESKKPEVLHKEEQGERFHNRCAKNLEDSRSSSPVRPPRPRRQASISRHKGSIESLDRASINSSSTECLKDEGTSSSKKVVPPKPKRTTLPRVNRSLSDVTGSRFSTCTLDDDSSHVSQNPNSSSSSVEEKPFLPQRLESLKRYDSWTYQTPPPLPPRNKPRSTSLKEPSMPEFNVSSSDFRQHGKPSPTEGEPVLKGNASTTNVKFKEKDSLIMSNSSCRDPTGSQSSASPPSTNSERRAKSTARPKPRPTRMAPPPPHGGLKLSATFSSGDSKSATKESKKIGKDFPASSTSNSTLSTPMQRKANSMVEMRDDEDHDYHEIPEGGGNQQLHIPACSDDQPPPVPPRGIEDNQNSRMTHKSELCEKPGKSLALKEDSDNSDNQKQKAEKAKAALIQNVSHGLALPKSLQDSKDPVDSDNTVHNCTTTDNHEHDRERDDKGSVLRKLGSDASGSSSSSSVRRERRVSLESEQSIESEQDGICNAEIHDEIVSSESESEAGETEEIYAQRKAQKVFYIAEEIMSSERTFVDVLRLLNVEFRVHVSKTTEKLGQAVIPSETLNKILDNLPQLQHFNEVLLKDLNDRIKNWETNPRISDIFVKKGPFLKLYSTYIRDFESATALLDDACKKNSTFAGVVKDFEKKPMCANLSLKDYMLKPIQRIPQYRLLLHDYYEHLLPGSPDHKDTIKALSIVSEVADHANKSLGYGTAIQKLMEIQRSLIGDFDVIQPGRALVMEGVLQKVSRKVMQPRKLILFSDVLLYTIPVTVGYKINHILPLTGMKVEVNPKLEDYKFGFSIKSTKRSFTVCAETLKEKEDWLEALRTAIQNNNARVGTFESVKPVMAIEQDKDIGFGYEAPLWVPDAKVTMCSLCLAEFCIICRRHHCRCCGKIICAKCSNNKIPLKCHSYKLVRACNMCFSKYKEIQNERAKNGDESADTGSNSVRKNSDDSKGGGGEMVDEDESGPSTRKVPLVLREVPANVEDSDMSGYLSLYKDRKWKKLWYVVKGNVLYTYKASEDRAAAESMPVLGYEVTRPSSSFEGTEPDLLFELTHQNTQPLLSSKSRKARNSVMDKKNQRLIFRTDSADATTKWVTVLRKATLA